MKAYKGVLKHKTEFFVPLEKQRPHKGSHIKWHTFLMGLSIYIYVSILKYTEALKPLRQAGATLGLTNKAAHARRPKR